MCGLASALTLNSRLPKGCLSQVELLHPILKGSPPSSELPLNELQDLVSPSVASGVALEELDLLKGMQELLKEHSFSHNNTVGSLVSCSTLLGVA